MYKLVIFLHASNKQFEKDKENNILTKTSENIKPQKYI